MSFQYKIRIIDDDGLSNKIYLSYDYEGDFNMENFVKEVVAYPGLPTYCYAILVETPLSTTMHSFIILTNPTVLYFFKNRLEEFINTTSTNPKSYFVWKQKNSSWVDFDFSVDSQRIIHDKTYLISYAKLFTIEIQRYSQHKSFGVYIDQSTNKMKGIYIDTSTNTIQEQEYVDFDGFNTYPFIQSIESIDCDHREHISSISTDISNIHYPTIHNINSKLTTMENSIDEMSQDIERMTRDVQSVTGELTNRYVSR